MTYCDVSETPKPATDEGLSLAAASEPTLAAQARKARDAFTRLDELVARALNGQLSVGRQALKAGYIFTCDCLAKPDVAARLPGWDDVTVRDGTNPYYRPLKYVARDVCDEVTAKLTMWAAIYRDAANGNIDADDFLDVLKRNHGVRAWYKSLCKAANDNEPGCDAGSGSEAVSFDPPANDNNDVDPDDVDPGRDDAGTSAPTASPTVTVAPSSAPPPEPAPTTVANDNDTPPNFSLAIIDLDTVASDVLAALKDGGYAGITLLHGVPSTTIARFLNHNGLDARGTRGVAR